MNPTADEMYKACHQQLSDLLAIPSHKRTVDDAIAIGELARFLAGKSVLIQEVTNETDKGNNG